MKKKSIDNRRIKLTIEYLGTNFCGYQVQPNKRTVEGELEKVLSQILESPTKVYASGRTDAGVHSLGQVIHFDTNNSITTNHLMHELSLKLPIDISALKAEEVSEDFDARFSVKKKTYIYKFYLSRFERPTLRGFALRINDNVDVELMKKACDYFIGTHDFKAFVARKSGKNDFVRTIYSAKINKIDDIIYEFEITANGFLYNMVRIIMGTLIDVGSGRRKLEDISHIISERSRTLAGKTISPCGLYMKSVEY